MAGPFYATFVIKNKSTQTKGNPLLIRNRSGFRVYRYYRIVQKILIITVLFDYLCYNEAVKFLYFGEIL